MPEYLSQLFERYRTRGLLLDANLLLLYIVGRHDVRLVSSFKRTRVFTVEDFHLLVRITHFFERVVTTPHVLTEVNGLSNQMPGNLRYDYYGTFGETLSGLDEQAVLSSTIAQNPAFRILGLTDAAIVEAAKEPVLILSVDLDLVLHLQGLQMDALNFNHIRMLGWTS